MSTTTLPLDQYAYTHRPPRYAKNIIAVQCLSTNIWKTRAGFIAEKFTQRYSNREASYMMSPTQFAKFVDLVTAEINVETRRLAREKASLGGTG